MNSIKIFDLKFSKKDINFFINNSKNIFKEGFLVIILMLKNSKNHFKELISLNLH